MYHTSVCAEGSQLNYLLKQRLLLLLLRDRRLKMAMFCEVLCWPAPWTHATVYKSCSEPTAQLLPYLLPNSVHNWVKSWSAQIKTSTAPPQEGVTLSVQTAPCTWCWCRNRAHIEAESERDRARVVQGIHWGQKANECILIVILDCCCVLVVF